MKIRHFSRNFHEPTSLCLAKDYQEPLPCRPERKRAKDGGVLSNSTRVVHLSQKYDGHSMDSQRL